MLVVLADDLMMRSRVSTAAAHAGVEVRFAVSATQAAEWAASGATVIAVDLNHRRISPATLVETLRAAPGLAGIRVVGFVSHVDTAAIAAARQAGIGEVLARSAFVDRLPELLHQSAPAPAEDRQPG